MATAYDTAVLKHLVLKHHGDARMPSRLRINAATAGWVAAVLILTLLGRPGIAANTSSYDLATKNTAGDTHRIQVEIHIEGELKLNADGQAVRKLPLRVTGRMGYVERMRGVEAGSRSSIRHYDQAQASMRIGTMSMKSALQQDRQLIGVGWNTSERPVVYSPSGPLTQEELELIDLQANTLCLTVLAPKESVKVGDTWEHKAPAMVALLNLDAVVKTDVKSKLLRVKGDVATVELAGTVDGVVAGIATEIAVSGQWMFDVSDRRVQGVNLRLKENRVIGHSQPGFETETQIAIRLEPISTPFPVDDQVLADLDLSPSESNQWLRFASGHAGVRFVHDRHWSIMADHVDGVVMRHVDGGELIAQCNIVPLRKLEDGQQLSLEQFQTDVKQTLDGRFGQFVEASQSQEQGLRVLRVVASGKVSDLPIRWIYYHVSDVGGNRASVVFTLEEPLVERFGLGDLPVVRSLEFVKKQGPEQP